ncbi:MAG: aminotransferase class V-fold PLP-dependent enzyme [Planctomycetes bacterium]|nr:aminotransferase class V-fold PLP-dependent enzyme [Planctomycetota bacterium]
MTTYLDNAATSHPKPEPVYRALDRFAREEMANPGRAGHRMSLAAERVLDDARHRLNQFFGGASPDRWILTLNCTDALNIAIKGIVQQGDHVITSTLEHNSISRPLRAMELAGKITLTRVEADERGLLRLDQLEKALARPARLVAITHASNVLGTVQPIDEIGALARARGAAFLVDAAQTAGVLPIDVSRSKIDLLAMAGHKGLFGPVGTGALYVAPGLNPRPWREGGTGGDSSSETQPALYPYHLEGGTPNVLGVAGLVAGLKWLAEKGIGAIHDHEVALARRLVAGLGEIPGVEVFGTDDWSRRVATVPFRLETVPVADVGGILDSSFNIAVRPGLHCAPYVHKAIGTAPEGLVRASPGPFNTEADIDALISAVREIAS